MKQLKNKIPSLDEITIEHALNKAKNNQGKANDIKAITKKIDEKSEKEKIDEQNADIRARKFEIKEKLITKILNKEQEREKPRECIKKVIIYFLTFQLIFLGVLIVAVLISKGNYGSFNNEVFLEILEFLKFLITSIVVEFIAMIFFIVRFLYDNKLIEVLEQWYKDL